MLSGQGGLRFVRIAPPLEGILKGRTYCGYACLRADLLESIEEIDTLRIDTLVRDREQVLTELRLAQARAEHVWLESMLDRAQELASRARSELLDESSDR